MKIYIDSDYKCHTAPGDGLTEVQSSFFDEMAPNCIEGYRFVPEGKIWTREDGMEFHGEMIAAWVDCGKLDATQNAYNAERITELESTLAEIKASQSGGSEEKLTELDEAYQEGVNSL